MAIKIPTAHVEPLRELATMSLDSRNRFVDAIRAASAVIDPNDLIARVVSETKIPEKTIEPIVWMLISMFGASESARDAFSGRVADAAKDLFSGSSGNGVDWAAFAKDLTALLGCDDSLGVTAKSVDVRREYGNVFYNARILTDIRPVFGPDPTRPPLAGAVVHTLRMSYYMKEDSRRDFYVALDAADLRKLRELVDRAIKKEASLKAQIRATDMQYLEVEVH